MTDEKDEFYSSTYLAETRDILEENFKMTMQAFHACPPQNPREIQVCESVRSTMLMMNMLLQQVIVLTKDREARAVGFTGEPGVGVSGTVQP